MYFDMGIVNCESYFYIYIFNFILYIYIYN